MNDSVEQSIAKKQKSVRVSGILAKYGTLIGLALLLIFFSVSKPNAFPTLNNFINIFNQGSLATIIACGLTAVVIVGEFDMSFAYLSSYTGVLVCGFMVNYHLPVPVAMLVTACISVLIGLVNGFLVAKLKINSVIATIGTGGIIVGLNYAFTNGAPIATGVPKAFLNLSLYKLFGVIPMDIIYMFIVIAILWVVLNKTELGYQIQAVGGNMRAAELSGINAANIKMIAFAICSLCAGITGMLLASLIGSGSVTAGDGYMMNAFAAVFLGSTTLRDGEFHIIGTFVGVFIINIGFNGLSIFGVDTYFQYVFRGALLVLAVALSTIARERARN